MKKVILVGKRTNAEGQLSGYVINFSDGTSVFCNVGGFGLALQNSGLNFSSNDAIQLLPGATCVTPIYPHDAGETIEMEDGTEVLFKNAGHHVQNGTVLSFQMPADYRAILATNAANRTEKTDIELALELLFAGSKRKKVVAINEEKKENAPINEKKERINKTIDAALAES